MKRSRKALAFGLGLWVALPLGAAQTNYGVGSLAAPWLELSLDSRAAAMGAQAGVAQGLGSLGTNAAGLAGLKGWKVEAGHTAWIESTALEHGALGWGKGGTGLALSFDYLSLGSVDAYTLSGGTLQANGSFSPNAYTASLGLGQEMGGGVRVGVAAKLVAQSLDGSTASSAVAGDLGLDWALGRSGIRLGLAAQNLGGTLDGASLPEQLKAGLGWTLGRSRPLTLAADYVEALAVSDGSANTVALGAEWWLYRLLALRAGYVVAQRGGLDGTAGLGLGLGLRYSGWELGYAYRGLGELGAGQTVELGLGW